MTPSNLTSDANEQLYSDSNEAITADELTLGLVQQLFRFRNDDSNEANASWIAGEGANISRNANTNLRVRFQIDSVGNVASTQLQLEYKEANSANWKKVN